MKTLQELREIVIENFGRSVLVPQLAEMNEIMSTTLLRTPIANFEEGYKSFISQVAKEALHYDSWLLTLFDTGAAVGDLTGIANELNLIVKDIRDTMPGGQTLTMEFSKNDRSFLVAFVYRITLSLATLKPEEPKEEGKP